MFNPEADRPATSENLHEALPGLKGLAGGKKQAWINANLDFILMYYEQCGFERACTFFSMKADTLSKALQKAERRHRPSVTKAERAMNQAYLANQNYRQLKPEVESMVKTLDQHIEDDQELRKVLSDFFQLQATVNNMMAKIVQNQDYIMSNLTEQIASPNQREVGLTLENVGRKGTKRIKAGSTSRLEAGRFSVTGKRETGKRHTSRSGKTLGTLRDRYQNAKRRFRRV